MDCARFGCLDVAFFIAVKIEWIRTISFGLAGGRIYFAQLFFICKILLPKDRARKATPSPLSHPAGFLFHRRKILLNLVLIIIIHFHFLQTIPSVRDSSSSKNKLLIPINSVFHFEELLKEYSIKRMARPNIKTRHFLLLYA